MSGFSLLLILVAVVFAGYLLMSGRAPKIAAMFFPDKADPDVCRQNIWRRSRRRLAERGPRPGVDIKRRACGAASVGVRWSSV